MKNKKYFHWYMTDSTDGEYLRISDIESVSVKGFKEAENPWDTVTVDDGTYKIVSIKSMVHKTEKSALKYAVKSLKTSIFDLKDPTMRVAPPSNHKLWINKASDKLKEFNLIYSDKYPELFI